MSRGPRRLAEDADRQFPVRVRIEQPPGGLGQRFSDILAWLDANCGADGWVMAPAGIRGSVNDALAIHFLDATLAAAFVARWCAANRVQVTEGVYCVRDDAPKVRVPAPHHKTP